MNKLHIQLLGGFRITAGNSPLLGFHRPRWQGLLSYLVLQRHKPQSRQQIAFLFWPDSTEKQAHTNLRKLVHSIRRALPDSAQYLEVTTKTIQWRPEVPCTVDVVLFEERLEEVQESQIQADIRSVLKEATEFYAGDLLPGFYDEWLLFERERLRELYADALLELVKLHENIREYDLALSYAQRLLNQDRLQESTYRLLIRLHLLQDDRAAALHTYHICATILREELAVEPSTTTEKLRQRVLRLEGEEQLQVPAAATAAKLPLVGRHREWLQLRERWGQAQKGSSSLLLIQGEAGIGKTRLAEELVDIANRQGMNTVHTRAYAAQGAAAYAPIVNMLRTERHLQALRTLDDVWLTELSRLLPELLSNRPDLPAPLTMTEAWQQRRFHEALARGFWAAGQPLLLHFDDLQWCDGQSLAWLRFLLEYDHQARLLVVGTVRDDEIDETHAVNMLHYDLQQRNRSLTIDLQPLRSDEVAQLAIHLLGQKLPQEMTARLYAETAGSPLFVLEMLRSGDYAPDLIKKERLNVGVGEQNGNVRHLPPKIQAVIKWRLGQLSPPARQLAGTAAIIGRSFSDELLIPASGQQPEVVVRGLDELWRRRIIREQGTAAYDFSHDYIREVAYNEVSPIRRRHLHHQVALTLRDQHSAQLDPISAQIALHYEQAGAPEEARVFFEHAGDYAANKYANEEADSYYGRALALLPDNAYKVRFELHLKREAIFSRTAKKEVWREELKIIEHIARVLQSEDDTNVRPTIEYALRLSRYATQATNEVPVARLEQAIALAQRHNLVSYEARAQMRIGAVFFHHAKYDEAARASQRAIELANKSELVDVAAEAYEVLAAVLMFTGAPRATIEKYVRKTLEYSQHKGDPHLEANCYNKLGYLPVAQGEGNYEQAREYYGVALNLAQNLGSISLECLISGNIGVLLTHTGEYEQAKNSLDYAVSRAKQSGIHYYHGVRLNYFAFLYFNIGHYEKSRKYQVAAIEDLMSMNQLGRLCKVHSQLGLMAYTLGQLEIAGDHLERALSMALEIGDGRQLGNALTRQGRVLTVQRRFTDAKAAFDKAMKLHRNLEQSNRSIMAVAGLAGLSLAQGKVGRSQRHAEEILAHLQTQRLELTDESLAVYMSAYQVLRTTGDNRAEKMLQMACDQLEKRAGSLDDEALQKVFWEAPPHADVLMERSKIQNI